jgi:hypothetical protein
MILSVTASESPRPSGSKAAPAASTDVAEWLRLGREALRARRYAEARDLFDRALAAKPDDPEVQALAVTAEFWRRLAREGDGFAPATPPTPRLSRRAEAK